MICRKSYIILLSVVFLLLFPFQLISTEFIPVDKQDWIRLTQLLESYKNLELEWQASNKDTALTIQDFLNRLDDYDRIKQELNTLQASSSSNENKIDVQLNDYKQIISEMEKLSSDLRMPIENLTAYFQSIQFQNKLLKGGLIITGTVCIIETIILIVEHAF